MRLFFLIILVIILCYPIYRANKDNTQFYQLPFLVALTTIGFILPTLISQVSNHYVLTDKQYNLYVLNTILCIIGSYVGYFSKFKTTKKGFQTVYSISKVLRVITPFFLIGFYISFFVLKPEDLGGSTEGIQAIYIYFSRLIRPTAIIVFIFLLTRKKYALILFALYIIVAFRFIVISGRRSELFTLAITVMLPLFFVKNYIPSKKVASIGFTIGVIAFLIMPIIRVHTREGDFSKLSNLSYQSVIEAYYGGERTNEVVEAAINMNIVRENNGYSFGARFINKFTHQFVSTTLFGNETKKNAKIEVFNFGAKRNLNYENSKYKGYLTHTGFADTFYDFGWLSFLLFFLFAKLSKLLWIKAFFSNNLLYKMFYCYFVTMIFMSVYDSISFIPTNIILGLVVFSIVSYFAKVNNILGHKLK